MTDIYHRFFQKESLALRFNTFKEIEVLPSYKRQEIFDGIASNLNVFENITESKSFILALLCYDEDKRINSDRVKNMLSLFKGYQDVFHHTIATFIEQIIDYNPVEAEKVKDIVCNILPCNASIAKVLVHKCEIDTKLLKWLNHIPDTKVLSILITKYPHLLDEKMRLMSYIDSSILTSYLREDHTKQELIAFVDHITKATKKGIYLRLQDIVTCVCKYKPELLSYIRRQYNNIFFQTLNTYMSIEQYLFVNKVNQNTIDSFVDLIKKSHDLDESNYYILQFVDEKLILESLHALSTSVAGIYFLSVPVVKKCDAKILAKLFKTGLKSNSIRFCIGSDTEITKGIIHYL
ncbi:MAG: hypothetical protein QW561_02305, partial [Candidatus Aenigmatarchaeota archaeon]